MRASRSSSWSTASVTALGPQLRPDALDREQLQQEAVRPAAIQDVRGADAGLERVHGRLELRSHAAAHLRKPLAHLPGGRLRDAARGVVGLGPPALDVRQEDELESAERLCHGRRGGVRVDVVGVALDVGPDGGHHRDVVLGDVEEHVHIDGLDLAHEADVRLAARELLLHGEEASIVAAEPDRRLPVAVDPQDDVLVLLADEHHLRHLDGGLVRHAQAVHEADLHAEPLHVARDVGAAAVDDDRVHPHVLEEDHVAGELLAQLRLHHRGAAVFDHDGLAVELPDVRERLEQRCDVSHDVYSALNFTYSGLRSLKKTSVSPPSPGRVSAYSTSSPWTSSAGAGSTTSPAETT